MVGFLYGVPQAISELGVVAGAGAAVVICTPSTVGVVVVSGTVTPVPATVLVVVLPVVDDVG